MNNQNRWESERFSSDHQNKQIQNHHGHGQMGNWQKYNQRAGEPYGPRPAHPCSHPPLAMESSYSNVPNMAHGQRLNTPGPRQPYPQHHAQHGAPNNYSNQTQLESEQYRHGSPMLHQYTPTPHFMEQTATDKHETSSMEPHNQSNPAFTKQMQPDVSPWNPRAPPPHPGFGPDRFISPNQCNVAGANDNMQRFPLPPTHRHHLPPPPDHRFPPPSLQPPPPGQYFPDHRVSELNHQVGGETPYQSHLQNNDKRRNMESQSVKTEMDSDSLLMTQNKLQHTGDASNIEQEKDRQFIAQWLNTKTFKTKEVKESKLISLPDYQNLVRCSLTLISNLNACTQQLTAGINCDENEWQEKLDMAKNIKGKLEEVLTQVNDKNLLDSVLGKIKKRRRKRERNVLQCKERYTENIQAEYERKEIDQQIDSWRQAILQKDLDEKREKEVKAAADSILGEVRKKRLEVERTSQVLLGLAKLRQLRKTGAEKRGLYTPRESDQEFTDKMADIVKLLNKHMDIYEREQQTLEVMLEVEQKESKEKERQNEQQHQRDRLIQWEKNLKRILFGKIESLDPSHPLFNHRQYYLQAEHSLDALINVRRQWDQYLVPQGTPGGSIIPTEWVLSSQPSSDVWKSALKDNLNQQDTAS